MSDICTIRKSTLDGIAEAIQSKTGESGGMLPSEMKGKIEDLPSQPAKGLVFSEYDSGGYPHKAEFVGSWTEIPRLYCYNIFSRTDGVFQRLENINIPEGVTSIGDSAFQGMRNISVTFPKTLTTIQGFYNWGYTGDLILPSAITNIGGSTFAGAKISSVNLEDTSLTACGSLSFTRCTNLKSITFPATQHLLPVGVCENCSSLETVTIKGNITQWQSRTFNNCPAVTMYDLSALTAIPVLPDTAGLGHASGCVIRIPSALSDQTLGAGNGWESATNWVGLTDVVWEVV